MQSFFCFVFFLQSSAIPSHQLILCLRRSIYQAMFQRMASTCVQPWRDVRVAWHVCPSNKTVSKPSAARGSSGSATTDKYGCRLPPHSYCRYLCLWIQTLTIGCFLLDHTALVINKSLSQKPDKFTSLKPLLHKDSAIILWRGSLCGTSGGSHRDIIIHPQRVLSKRSWVLRSSKTWHLKLILCDVANANPADDCVDLRRLSSPLSAVNMLPLSYKLLKNISSFHFLLSKISRSSVTCIACHQNHTLSHLDGF